MTTPNTIIADLSHEIDRLQRICNLLLSAAIGAEQFISKLEDDEDYTDGQVETVSDLRYAIDEAHHG